MPTFPMAKSARRSQTRRDTDSPSIDAPLRDNPPGDSYNRDRVAMRAYELYMARGASHGADIEDWLAAERQFESAEVSGTRDK